MRCLKPGLVLSPAAVLIPPLSSRPFPSCPHVRASGINRFVSVSAAWLRYRRCAASVRPARSKQAALWGGFAASRWLADHSKPPHSLSSRAGTASAGGGTSPAVQVCSSLHGQQAASQPFFSVTWQRKASKDPFHLGDVRSANLCFAAGSRLSNALRSEEAPTPKGDFVFLPVHVQHSSLKTGVFGRCRC